LDRPKSKNFLGFLQYEKWPFHRHQQPQQLKCNFEVTVLLSKLTKHGKMKKLFKTEIVFEEKINKYDRYRMQVFCNIECHHFIETTTT
jgi:hypothetical protein